MKKVLLASVLCGVVFLDCAFCDSVIKKERQKIERVNAGFKGDSKIFSGEVRVQMLFEKELWRDFNGALVHFSPKARSAWHSHPAGQTLIVTKGVIYTGTKDGITSVAKEGEVISCPPDVVHWHGAGLESSGEHIAIQQFKDNSNVVWGEKVKDTEYNAAIKSAK